MRIVMAAGALRGRAGKICMFQSSFQRRRPMAIFARYGSMCAKEREFGLRVVESAEFLPLRGRVACFASSNGAVGELCRHLFTELAGMWIVVACGAGTVFKLEFHRRN
jgi:hypothetical protein